jgi:chemotaxis protein CheX
MRLQSSLDVAAASGLWSDLCMKRGAPIVLDASGVDRLGGACLQVLLAAAAHWRKAGLEFRVADPSSAFLEALRIMGAQDAFQWTEAP